MGEVVEGTTNIYFFAKKMQIFIFFMYRQRLCWHNIERTVFVKLSVSGQTSNKTSGQTGGQTGSQTGGQTGGQTRERVYELIKTNPYITRDELSKVLGISPSAIQKHIDKLKEVRIRRIGGDFGGHWEIIEK